MAVLVENMRGPSTTSKNCSIEPIGRRRQDQVTVFTHGYILRACEIYGRRFDLIPVMFNLKGRAAGMYVVKSGQRMIRYNPYLFAKYFEDNVAATVPHEVAHYITDIMHGQARVRPHGAEWRAVMQAFGVEATATCRYDLTGIPVRAQRRHSYHCGCSTHQLTTRRHNQVRSGDVRCYCRSCGGELVYRG